MAKKPQSSAVSKASPKSLTKSGRIAQTSRSRAAPLATAKEKKTALTQQSSTKPYNRRSSTKKRGSILPEQIKTILDYTSEYTSARTAPMRAQHEEPKADGRTAEGAGPAGADFGEVIPERLAKPAHELRSLIKASGRRVEAPLADMMVEAAVRTARHIMPRAASMTLALTLAPLRMMMRQQTLAFNLMLDAIQMHRRSLDFWAPR